MDKQFIYVLRLIPSLLDKSNWTDKENEIIARHYSMLERLLREGKLILAGKTLGIDEKTFGIVILEAEDEKAATTVMSNDPAVAEGIMTAELYPYKVALFRGQKDE